MFSSGERTDVLAGDQALVFRIAALWGCRLAVEGEVEGSMVYRKGPEIFNSDEAFGAVAGRGQFIGKYDCQELIQVVGSACFHAVECCRYQRAGDERSRSNSWRRFSNGVAKVFDSSEFGDMLRMHAKWLIWNSAWRHVNLQDRNKKDYYMDSMRIELHFDEIIGYRHTPLTITALGHGWVEGCNRPRHTQWRGVNLGGWLLLEHWMNQNIGVTPHLDEHEGYDHYSDEWTVCKWLQQEVGSKGVVEKIEHHRATWITQDDFRKIKGMGLNAVRVPFGYWLVTGPREGEPFVGPSLEHLDNCMHWGEQEGLDIVLSLHSLPGFQSGQQCTGKENNYWTSTQWDVEASLQLLQIVVDRYKGQVAGICVCNEPSNKIPYKTLINFYRKSIDIIRSADASITILLPVYQRSFEPFSKEIDLVEDPLIIFDLHLYQCFGSDWESRTICEHLQESLAGTGHCPGVLDITSHGAKCVISEWSVRLPTWERGQAAYPQWNSLSDEEREAVSKSYGYRQAASFHNLGCSGWFYWTWKVDSGGKGRALNRCFTFTSFFSCCLNLFFVVLLGEEPWWSWVEGAEKGWLAGVEQDATRRKCCKKAVELEKQLIEMSDRPYLDVDIPAWASKAEAIGRKRRRSQTPVHTPGSPNTRRTKSLARRHSV